MINTDIDKKDKMTWSITNQPFLALNPRNFFAAFWNQPKSFSRIFSNPFLDIKD